MTTSRRRPKHDPKESEREILEAAEQFLNETIYCVIRILMRLCAVQV
jgi:hypothetical protein